VSQDQSAACASGSAALEFGYSFDISKINHVHSSTTDDQQANDSCFDNQLYSLFKVANGEDISKATAPGMFDLKGKAKHKAWQKEIDAGTSASDAESRYVALVEKLKEKYGYDANKKPEAVGSS